MYRVSTNLTGPISRTFPGDSRRDFKKNPGHVCIASACYVPNLLHLMDAVYPVLSKLYDRKPMRSSILHKNLQEDN